MHGSLNEWGDCYSLVSEIIREWLAPKSAKSSRRILIPRQGLGATVLGRPKEPRKIQLNHGGVTCSSIKVPTLKNLPDG